jgi:peptidoglycan/LPS O-acetylase OafA/YrhL
VGVQPLARIGDAQLSANGNDFTAVRLLLASCVIWTHSYWQVGGAAGMDEIARLVGLPISHLAVNGFFFVSGFLICQSVLRKADIIGFASMRFARIWPGLAVCCLLTVATFAVISGSPTRYASQGSVQTFLLTNLSLLKGAYELPDPFGAVGSIVINGSLWTIPWEVRCYAGLALVYAVTAAWRPQAVWFASLLAIVAAGVWTVGQASLAGFPDVSSGLAYNIDMAARLGGSFALGALAYQERGRIRLSVAVLVALIVLGLAEFAWAGTSFAIVLAAYYGVLVIAFGRGADRAFSTRWPDFSYGIYIYAFPAMVLAHSYWPSLDYPALAAATLAITVPLAAASWYLVEKPALTTARTLLSRRSKSTVPAASGG